MKSADHSKLPRTNPPPWSSVSTLPRRTPALKVCVSLVPPGTLKPPPAHTPKSEGRPSRGLESWANAKPLKKKINSRSAPHRRGDAENGRSCKSIKDLLGIGRKEITSFAPKCKRRCLQTASASSIRGNPSQYLGDILFET